MRNLVPLLLLAGLPAAAQAQAAPDIGDAAVQSQQINAAVSRAAQGQGRGSDAVTAIDGEAGIYVLQLNRIFSLTASGAAGYTDNPLRTADNPGGSAFADFGAAAGVSTVIAQKIDFGLSAAVGGREYVEGFAPSNRTASGNVSLGTRIGGTPLYAGLIGFGGYSFEGDFTKGTSFYGGSASLSAVVPLTRTILLRPGAGVTRQWSQRTENNSTSYSASAEILAALGPDLTASLRGVVTRRTYDNFYEDVTFVERRDTLWSASALLAWRISPRASLSLSASFEKQTSSFFLANYDAVEGGAGFALRFAF